MGNPTGSVHVFVRIRGQVSRLDAASLAELAKQVQAATDALDGLTVAATEGSAAAAVVSDVDGHKHIDFTLPRASGGGFGYEIGHGLKVEEDGVTLSVDTADVVEADNTRPVTSAAVNTTVGNINVLLETI